jgi:putative AlgH/UPF0301 family transcriptional regulator
MPANASYIGDLALELSQLAENEKKPALAWLLAEASRLALMTEEAEQSYKELLRKLA